MTSILTRVILWPGDLAFVNVKGRGRTLVRITKQNPKNYKSELEDGSIVSGPHNAFTKAPEGTEWKSTKPVEKLEYLNPGTVVRFKPGTPVFAKVGSTPYVVTACGSDGRHRVFPLGGSQRYWRGIPSTDLEVIPAENVTITE